MWFQEVRFRCGSRCGSRRYGLDVVPGGMV